MPLTCNTSTMKKSLESLQVDIQQPQLQVLQHTLQKTPT